MPVFLRGLHPGDVGWIVERHGALHAREDGWNQEFEAVVARKFADYVDYFDATRDSAWIAEVDGARARSTLTAEDPRHRYGRDLIDQCWARNL